MVEQFFSIKTNNTESLNIRSFLLDGVFYILLLLLAFLVVIFVGWVMKKEDVEDEVTNSRTIRQADKLFPVIYFLIKWIAPAAVLLIFISNFIL